MDPQALDHKDKPVGQDTTAAQRPELGVIDHSNTGPSATGPASPSHHNDMSSSSSASELTPLRAHYLKKSLVSLQFAKELKIISNPSSNPNVSILSYLGPPFTPPPKDAANTQDLVFFSFIFRQFVLSFPFLASAPKNFFPLKLQPFIDSVLSRNLTGGYEATIDTKQEDAEELGRQKLLHKLEKQLTLLLGSSIKIAEKEEVVRLTQSDLDRLETLGRRRRERGVKVEKDIFEINVIGVRSVVEKGRIRSRVHEEFLVRTRRTGFKDIFVARRFGDFKTLWETLRKAHPEEMVPAPPGKDRSATMAGSSSNAPEGQSLSRTDTSTSSAPSLRRSDTALSTNSATQHRLSREKNRLTLRYYLNALLAHPVLASSPVFRSFLTSGPIKLSQFELEDAQRREEADRLREEGKTKFETEIKDRVEKLRAATGHIKADAMSKDGLTHIFATIRQTPNVKDLPPDFQAVLEWGRVTLASTIFQQFVAADAASESFASLKRIHGLMPYMVMKGILRISNPVAMIRGVLDLFTAQPFGGRSLLQRMFTSSLQEEAKGIQDDITMVSEKIEDPVLCEKVRQYVYAPKEIQEFYKAEAVDARCSLMTVILRSSESPALNRGQLQRLAKCSRAHSKYVAKKQLPTCDSDDDEGPSDDDGWLYEDLGVLMRLYGRLRDKEQLIALIFESTTADLLKDIITIFYAPLAQVYKAANIADSIGDLQNFVNDLIATVERLEVLGDENPGRTVQTFIDLVQRHEQAFYYFVHKVHSKGENLFNSLTRWVELFLTFMRDGLGDPISLEFILPHSEAERTAIIKEVDAVARYHYVTKVAHEEKVKRRFDSRIKDDLDAAEEDAAQDLVDSVLGDLSIGELMQGELSDLDPSDSSDEYESSDEETDEGHPTPTSRPPPPTKQASTGTTGSSSKSLPKLPPDDSVPPPPPAKDDFPRPSISTQSSANGRNSHDSVPRRKKTMEALHLKSGSGSARGTPQPSPALTQRRKRKLAPVFKEPELKIIPDLLPIFIEAVRSRLKPIEVPTAS